MMFSDKELPAFTSTVRSVEARWKGSAAGMCGASAVGLLRGYPGGAQVFPGGLPVALPEGETAAAAFAAGESLAVYCASGSVYFCSAAGTQKSGVRFARIPACARVYDGGEGFLLSDGKAVALLRESGIALSSAPPFQCAAFYGDRLWIAQGGEAGQLRYSAPADAFDFSSARGKGGSIELPSAYGPIVALAAFADGLLLFRERGVQRLRGRGDERDFAVSDLFACARICADTVAEASGRVVWLAEDGLHAFDGSERAFCAEAASVLLGVDQNGARAAAEDGRYYLQAKARAEDGSVVPVLAAVAADGTGASFLRCEAEGLTSSRRVLFVADGKVCAPSAGAFPFGKARRVYESEPCDPFGRRAMLREVWVRASGPFFLTAESDEGSRTSRLCGTGRTERVLLQLPGTVFNYRLETDAEGQVLALSATYVNGGVR